MADELIDIVSKSGETLRPERFGEALFLNLENFYPDYLPDGYTTRWT